MRVVLGIDAAWTAAAPSGVALAVETERGWRLAAVESSYERFAERGNGAAPNSARPRGSAAVAHAVLDAAVKLAGAPPDLIAVDMPLGPEPIIGRRPCDNAVSRAFGARRAAVHSPSAERPGPISDAFRAAFAAAGYSLCVAQPARGLIEVYPHAALINFLNAPERLKYKVGRLSAYWPLMPGADRHARLRETWRLIVLELERRIAGVAQALPVPALDVRGWRLKAFEDKLDAVVCSAVAVACLDGRATLYGDASGVIWVPTG
jgi:predicted RNase H-like nuclease